MQITTGLQLVLHHPITEEADAAATHLKAEVPVPPHRHHAVAVVVAVATMAALLPPLPSDPSALYPPQSL